MSKDKQLSEEKKIWKTGDLVLCKVGSFPPWPAVVFPQRFLRQDVYKKKKPGRLAVCFFNDPTYYWEQPQRLNPLSLNTINEVLKNKKTSNNEPLMMAYKESKKYYDLETFIKNRFIQENRLDKYSDEVMMNGPVVDGESPFITREDIFKEKAKLSKELDSKNDKNEKVNPIKKTNKIKESVVKDKPTKPEVMQDSNHKDTKLRGKAKIKAHSKLDRSRQIEIALLFRRRIQSNLVQRDIPPTNEGVEECHKLLDKIYENIDTEPPFFDLKTLRKSKLHKLLKVIVNDYKLEEFHQICKDILSHWAPIIIELKREKEAEKSKDHATK